MVLQGNNLVDERELTIQDDTTDLIPLQYCIAHSSITFARSRQTRGTRATSTRYYFSSDRSQPRFTHGPWKRLFCDFVCIFRCFKTLYFFVFDLGLKKQQKSRFWVLGCILAPAGRLWGLPWDALGIKMASKSDANIEESQFFFDLGEFGSQNSNFNQFRELWGWFGKGFKRILRGFGDNFLRI